MSTIAPKLQRAVSFLETGNLADADRLCQEILRMEPRHCDALHLRGLAALQNGKLSAGIEWIHRSLTINPNQPLAHSNLGNALLKLDRVEEALEAFNRALRLDPNLFLALYNRGHALLALGRYEEALATLDRALRSSPGDPDALGDHAFALLKLGRADDALQDLAQALKGRPRSTRLHNDFGNALLELGRYEEALAFLDQALTLQPMWVEALNNRGRALTRLKWHDQALESLDHAVRLHPEFVEARNNRGSVLLELKRYGEALDDFDRALAIQPALAEAHSNRSMALFRLNRYEDALASADRALAVNPNFPEALNNRGLALGELFRPDEAESSYRRALALLPGYAEARKNLGACLGRLKRYREALAIYDDALTHEPGSAPLHFNRALLLLDMSLHEEAATGFARVLAIAPDYPYATGYALYTSLLCCDWRNFEERAGTFTDLIASGGRAGDPLQSLVVPASAADHLRCARRIVDDHYPGEAAFPLPAVRSRHDRIRIAYLSADFGDHPVSHVAAGVIERHDRDRFDILGFALQSTPQPHPMRKRMEGAFERFYDVSRHSDREVSTMLRDMAVDIVVDLNGHTSGGRPGILARRPAPIQVNYLGFPGTFGAEYMDYVIADPVVILPEDDPFFVERVVRLPHAYLPYDDSRPVPLQSPSRLEAGLPPTGFVFCAFNNTCKINPAMFDTWMRLLGKVPESVLWLRAAEDAVQRNLRSEATTRGVAPERLIFAPRVAAIEAHLARHRLADLFLDTLPYNAHSTAADALWAGVPVLTCIGNTFAGRVAASLLTAVGLPELITRDLHEYEALALTLASSASTLKILRDRLHSNRLTCPLFATDRYRRHLECAYRTMWKYWLRGQAPESFAVEPLPSD